MWLGKKGRALARVAAEPTSPDLGRDEVGCVQSSVYSSVGDECRLPDCDNWRWTAHLSIMESLR